MLCVNDTNDTVKLQQNNYKARVKLETHDSPTQARLVGEECENTVDSESRNITMQTKDSPKQTLLVDEKDENMVENESKNTAKQQQNDTPVPMQTEDSPLKSKVGDGVAQDIDHENKNQNKSNDNPHWQQYMKEQSLLPIPCASRGFYGKQNLIATKNSTRTVRRAELPSLQGQNKERIGIQRSKVDGTLQENIESIKNELHTCKDKTKRAELMGAIEVAKEVQKNILLSDHYSFLGNRTRLSLLEYE